MWGFLSQRRGGQLVVNRTLPLVILKAETVTIPEGPLIEWKRSVHRLVIGR